MNEEKDLMGDIEEQLKVLIPKYEANKSEMDYHKKLADNYNQEIKRLMISGNLEEIQVGNLTAKINISERTKFIEEALIEKIRPFKIRGAIKKREYVDMPILEKAIYDKKIDASILSDCQEIKEVVTLRINKGRI